MDQNPTKYENLEVKALLGFEAKTRKKWESEGWEFVSEVKGKLQTTILFRRVKKPISMKLVALGALGVIALASIITVGALTEEKPSSITGSETTQAPDEGTVETTDVPEEQLVLTVENNEDLARLLSDKSSDTDYWQEFFDKYSGRTMEFDGNIAFMANTPGYKYTVDCLIEAGNYSETSSIGPPFRAPMVNIHSGFNLEESGDRSTLFQGENIRIAARIVDYNPLGQTFEIDIISTRLR